jgi:hypothetical protein
MIVFGEADLPFTAARSKGKRQVGKHSRARIPPTWHRSRAGRDAPPLRVGGGATHHTFKAVSAKSMGDRIFCFAEALRVRGRPRVAEASRRERHERHARARALHDS